MTLQNDLTDFFMRYGTAFNDSDKLADFYGDCAMASTPTFVGCLNGHKEIEKAMENIAQGQIRTGMRSLEPLNVEAMPVDSLHAWVRVHWAAKFRKTRDQLIQFDISYLVRKNNEKYVILFSVAHQDEQKMREELGIS